MVLFRDRVLIEVIKLKWSLEWVLLHYDRYTFKKRISGHRYAQEVYNVMRHEEDRHLQATERGLEIIPSQPSEGSSSVDTLIPDF